MAVTSMKCPSCGAGIDQPPGVRSFSCEYCGNQVQVAKAAKPAPPLRSFATSVPGGSTIDPATASKTAGRIVLVTMLGIFLLVGGILASVYYTVSRATSAFDRETPAISIAIPGLGSSAAIPGLEAKDFVLWDDVAGDPLPITIAGKPAFVGRVRVMPADELFFLAIDSEGVVLSRTGPFGTYSSGYRHTLAAVAGERLVISDADAKVHIAEAATGSILKTLDLSDRVKLICAAADGSSVWIEQVDKRSFLLDPKGGELREGERPEPCIGAKEPLGTGISSDQRRTLKRLSKGLESFSASGYLEDGERTILAGHRSPGTEVPQAIGLDPDGAIAWRVDVPTIDPLRARERSNTLDALGGGRYVTVYGEGEKSWHVTALDPDTGDRLWDQSLRTIQAVDSIDGVVATADYILVVRTSSLEILDPKSGALRQTIGREFYQ